MKYAFLILLFILVRLISFAQTDSVLVNDKKEKRNFKFLLSFDNRNSSVLDEPVKFNGLKIGLEYRDVHDFGLGIYSTRIPVRKNAKQPGQEIEASLNYTTIFYQYAFFHNEKWELALPFHLGSGKADLKIIDPKTNSVFVDENGKRSEDIIKFPISELGFEAQYKIWPWFGVGAGVGYRFTFTSDENAKRLLNAPTYAFKIKIFLGELYKTIKEKVKKKDEPDN